MLRVAQVAIRPAPSVTRAARRSPELLLVLGLTALAAVVRFASLAAQSYWYDEALTIGLVRESFGGMLHSLFSGNAEPPPYFLVAWVWARLFGYGEAGLRSLSAVAGTLTVPAAYAVGRIAGGMRAGVAVAAVAAVSPALVWYSQEARAYALMTLLCAMSLLCFLRVLQRPAPGRAAAWVAASLLAFLTHYFALFLVVPEAVWLLLRAADRRVAIGAVAALAVGLAAAMPMLLYQLAHGEADWIGGTRLAPRVADAGSFFVVGPHGPGLLASHHVLVDVVAAVVALAAIAAALHWGGSHTSRGVLLLAGLGAAAIVIPLAAARLGHDFVLDRNLLPAWLPLAAAATAALCVRKVAWVGVPLVVVAVVVLALVDQRVATDRRLQRDDWRGVARVLGPARADRIVAVSPGWQAAPLRLYAHRMRPQTRPHAVREVDAVTYDGFTPFASPVVVPPPAPPFRVAGRVEVQNMTVVRYAAPAPVVVDPRTLTGTGENAAHPFVQGP